MKYGERCYLADLPEMTWFYNGDDGSYELKMQEGVDRRDRPNSSYTKTWRFYSLDFSERSNFRVYRVELPDVIAWAAGAGVEMPDCFPLVGDVYTCPKCSGKKFFSEAKIGKRDPITGERSVSTNSTTCELCNGVGRVSKEKRDEFTGAAKELVNAVEDDS